MNVPRLAPALTLCLTACPRDLPPEQPCDEVGYALASRYEQCTGDVEAALALYDRFEAEVACTIENLPGTEPGTYDPAAYECAFVLRSLACELVVAYGDDLDAWFASSPVCGLLLEGP